MVETDTHTSEQTTPVKTPKAKTPVTKKSVKPARIPQQNNAMKVAALGFFCFVLSFLGAGAAIESGLIKTNSNSSINDKRQVVVQGGEVVADVAKQVSPSVVSIVTQSQSGSGYFAQTSESAGTGIVISKDGYILTNRHVVEGATEAQVVMSDGTTHENVKVVGTDTANDLAFLKIDGVSNLTAATLGDSSTVTVGQPVVAIGNALGQYQTSVTSGIISGLGRPLVAGDESGMSSESLSNLFQTDAAINPGNSGGPLVNMAGQIIGINTAIDQEAQGIGFAIPINDAKGLITSVTKSGKLSRAFLGVSYVSVTADVANQYHLSVQNGAYVTADSGSAVTADSPAEKAGLKNGDVITKVDGKGINEYNPLLSALSTHQPGDSISLTYLRDGKESTVQVTLGTYPNEQNND